MERRKSLTTTPVLNEKMTITRENIPPEIQRQELINELLGTRISNIQEINQEKVSPDSKNRDGRAANYTTNWETYTVEETIELQLGASRNLGSPAMLNAKKSPILTAYYVLLSTAIGLGFPSAMMNASMQLGKDRAKGIYQTQLDILILKEIQRSIKDGDAFNIDNIRYMDHRYIGGIANDFEAFSERANHMAMDELHKEMTQSNGQYVKDLYNQIIGININYNSTETEPKFTIPAGNIEYRNTCLTTGKDLFGTSVQSIYRPFKSPYSPFVKQCIQDVNPSTPDTKSTRNSFENSTVYKDWLKQLKSRVYYPAATDQEANTTKKIRPSFLAEYTDLRPATAETAETAETAGTASKAAEKYIELQGKIFINAVKGMHAFDKEAKNHLMFGDFSRHRTTQAAYENMLMEANGFMVSAGCKSSIDRAGVEYATRMAYKAYMIHFNSDPTNDWINASALTADDQKTRQQFLATEFLRNYTDISIDVGENNRGVLATKTFDQFVPPEIKFAMDEMSKRAKESIDKDRYHNLLTNIVNGNTIATEQVDGNEIATGEKNESTNLDFSSLHTKLSPSEYKPPIKGLDTRLLMLMVSQVDKDDNNFEQELRRYLQQKNEKENPNSQNQMSTTIINTEINKINACRNHLRALTQDDPHTFVALLQDAIAVEHRARDTLAVEKMEKLNKEKTWKEYNNAKKEALKIAKKGSALRVSGKDFLLNITLKSWIPTGTPLPIMPLMLLKSAIILPLNAALGIALALTVTAVRLPIILREGISGRKINLGDALISRSSLKKQMRKITTSRPKATSKLIQEISQVGESLATTLSARAHLATLPSESTTQSKDMDLKALSATADNEEARAEGATEMQTMPEGPKDPPARVPGPGTP